MTKSDACSLEQENLRVLVLWHHEELRVKVNLLAHKVVTKEGPASAIADL